jgi:glutathione S-transferase
MKLYGTLPSHFTRKVRVVLQELAIPFEFVALESLMSTEVANFAQNPLLQLPILEDGSLNLIESDDICEYLFQTYGHQNPEISFLPSGDLFMHKKRLAIMNGGMAAGVKLIRAKRSGVSWDYPFFQQEITALKSSLAWLDKDLGNRYFYGDEKLSLLEITLMCFAEWAVFREMIPSLAPYPNLVRFVNFHGKRASFAGTHPAAP